MGRKPAPQPLPLSDPSCAGHSQNVDGETEALRAPSPVSSKSPKSPRSPFRFGQKKSPFQPSNFPAVSTTSRSQPVSPSSPATHQPLASKTSTSVAPSPSALHSSPSHVRRESLEPDEPTSIDKTIHSSLRSTCASPSLLGQLPATAGTITNNNSSSTTPTVAAQPTLETPGVTVLQKQRQKQQHSRRRQQDHKFRNGQQDEEGELTTVSAKHSKSGGGRFFSHFKSSRPSPLQQQAPSSTPHAHIAHSKNASASFSTSVTLAAPHSGDNMSKGSDRSEMPSKSSKHSEQSFQRSILSHQQNPSRSDLSLASNEENDTVGPSAGTSTPAKRSKPKPFTLLNRSRSNREKDLAESSALPSTSRLVEPEKNQLVLKTAPVSHDRTFRDMMNSTVRNRSEDRAQHSQSRDTSRNRDDKHVRTQPSSFKENSGSTFLSNLRNSSRTAADMFSKGIFGKGGRSTSTSDKEPVVDDDHYILKVINLPLIDQTRLTRISKRLEDSRDKTEFWMPAFPWRAIDYLNYKGCDVEGLYRVPGSGPQVKKWQRKFDEEYDVDLFAQDDLYDINIVGSMLKAWLRELPDELFPKASQERVARECAGAEKVPQLLIDELSNLPPFHYYLLFAITCHLSLLLAHSDKNKMDFRNLCICFQPCMKIDAFCFKFLVCDWRDCWKGCKNEAKYIEEEYLLFDQPPPPGISETHKKGQSSQQPPQLESSQQDNSAVDDRTISSSDSKQPTPQENQKGGRLKKKGLQKSRSNGSVASHSTISTALTINSEQQTPPRQEDVTLRPLSPIKPLSPLGF